MKINEMAYLLIEQITHLVSNLQNNGINYVLVPYAVNNAVGNEETLLSACFHFFNILY